MTPNKPTCSPTQRYNQSEAAAILQVDRHTIRRYELGGLINFKIRKAGNAKFTTGQQIIKCWEACYL